jgi:hypothetical protein
MYQIVGDEGDFTKIAWLKDGATVLITAHVVGSSVVIGMDPTRPDATGTLPLFPAM